MSESITLPTLFQQFIHKSRYSRWIYEENRRETWIETVKRYFDFFEEHLQETLNYTLTEDLRNELELAVLNLEIMPSMRCLMTAGKALKRDNICAYNCAYTAIDRPSAFDEILYILMNGTGVGFSVERQFVNELPRIAEDFYPSDTTIQVKDSKSGWARALKELIAMLYHGQIPQIDTSKIRPAGSPLKTFGGRASGPEPLEDLFKFTINVFRNAAGRKLTSIECHDIVCKIAEIVVVGGVRRSALISLSNLSDDRMRTAKAGAWWDANPQRRLANNSACYTEKPEMGVFMEEWKSLYISKSGERGIFNREAATKIIERLGDRRSPKWLFGCNPCSEILLRPEEFCNLTEVIARETDTPEDLRRKVRLATILGTFQSTLTNFKYISKRWQKNCEEERLLGVSITGILDNSLLAGKEGHEKLASVLDNLREHTIEVNKEFADALGINQSAAITCVKPSGTVSQLVNSASGIHTRHSPFYIRTVRGDNKDPLTQMMKDVGFVSEPCVMSPNHTTVFSFPVKSPQNAVFREDMTAVEHLELWLLYQKHWCEHKPSITISVKEHEWMEVGAWVYKNFDWMSGVSFLPWDGGTYQQAPYQECTEQEYRELLEKTPTDIDWSLLSTYEKSDMTEGAQELACSGGSCEIIDLSSKT